MFLSKRSNGIYYIHYLNSSNKRTRISTETKLKSEALKFLSNFERQLEERKRKRLPQVSLKDYSLRFLDYSRAVHTNKTFKAYELALNHLIDFLGDEDLSKLSFSQMNKYFEDRINNSSVYQARKELICFNSCFHHAIREGFLLINPCRNIKRFKIPQKQPQFFQEYEFDLLLNVIKEKDIRDLTVAALQTGLRQMELLTLEWSQINFKERILLLDNRNHVTKSKQVRSVPLSLKVMQVLTERESEKGGDLVFTLDGKPMTQDFITHRFKQYVRVSNINPQLNFHSLRHTFASWLVQKGVSIFVVSKLLGHSRVEVTQIYSHLRTEDLMKSIEVLNN